MLWKVLHSICNMQYALNMQYAGSRQVEKFLWDWLGGLSPLGLRVGAGGAGGGAHGLVDRFSCLALRASPAHSLHRTWSPRDLCEPASCW